MPYQRIESQYLDELLGSKLTWRVLRVLVMHPFLSFHLSDLAVRLETSNKSILRVMRKLIEQGLVLGRVGSHDLYKINPEMRMARKIWSIFMSERVKRIPEEIMLSIYPYFNKIKDNTDAFIICEYPSSEGMSIFKDSVSLAIVSETPSYFYAETSPSHTNIHAFTKQQFRRQDNPVAQSALLSGIVLRGEDFIFSMLSSLKSFPHSYILGKANVYSNALLQNGTLDKELKERQIELIEDNMHNFEIQLGIKDSRDNGKDLIERMDRLRMVLNNANSAKYV